MRGSRTSTRARVALGLLFCGYLGLAVVGGAPRSPVVPPPPPGVRGPGWATEGARLLGLDRLGPRSLAAVFLGLLALAVALFALLLLEGWRGRLSLGAALAGTLASAAVMVAAPLLLSRDVYSYAAYGRMLVVHGADPYRVPPAAFPGDPFTPVVSSQWLHMRSLYGPLFTLLSGGLVRMAPDPGSTVFGFKALAGLSLLVAAATTGAASRAVRPGREGFAAAAVGLNPVLVAHTVGGGHNDALVGALLAGGLLGAVRAVQRPSTPPQRPTPHSARGLHSGHLWGAAELAATLLLALAALVKAVAALPLLVWWWWLARSRWEARAPASRPVGWRRSLAKAAPHVGAAALVAGAVTLSVTSGWSALRSLVTLVSVEGWASGARLVARGAQALGEALGAEGAAAALRLAVHAGFLLVAASATWAVLRRTAARPGDPAGFPQGMRLADALGVPVLVFVLGSPYLLPWYAAWFAPFLPLLSDRVLRLAGLACAGLLALTAVPAEPASDPGLWGASLLAVHYAVAPLVLVLFGAAVTRVLVPGGLLPRTEGRRAQRGRAPGGSSPGRGPYGGSSGGPTVTSRAPKALA
ncbi:MAG TPA: hypothetical protein VNO79_00255 [Actinomycetota bacterium]|nr:hypothetical protein [Actinomycetota bacterium]